MKIEDFYREMKSVLSKYHGWAIEENTKIPRRWCVIGIEAWLDDFAERISQTDENKRELLKIDLQYEKQRLQLTNQMITKCNQVIQK